MQLRTSRVVVVVCRFVTEAHQPWLLVMVAQVASRLLAGQLVLSVVLQTQAT
jgi:hypothetical protein